MSMSKSITPTTTCRTVLKIVRHELEGAVGDHAFVTHGQPQRVFTANPVNAMPVW
jgi:hypothetical protein